ncbi:histidine triad nucleotide-binding protein [Desulfofundulus salinus]|uniref:Histidine triad nucleotide-binding protein n=1 Tax=Desulfofundulus salinus TaxID=2419843 RepID=A0A494X4L2_9FIRM|nr:histidine triad nucleotide-binding protein [Desulfofundulus salinum]RKO68075.1 histidine triad nucleotide-binding protein [Desulfofundulus salinum]
MQDCVFCKIVKKEIPAEIVYEDEHVMAFKDIHPAAPVHILLIPKKHISTFFDLTDEDVSIIGRVQLAAARVAKQLNLEEKGFRLVSNCKEDAGQLIFHIHYHLLGGRALQWPPG